MRPLTTLHRQQAAFASLQVLASDLNRRYTRELRPISARETELRNAARRRLDLGAALLSFSVLADSGIEHYRGSFERRAMYLPLGVAGLTLTASLFSIIGSHAKSHAGRDSLYGLAALTGAAGLGFHAYNVLKRPGRLSWLNLFHGAPLGAPVALLLAGLLGWSAERVRDERASTILGLSPGKALSAITCTGLAGTVAEAALLHFRGAYQNPAMFLPVTLPPVAALLMAATTVLRDRSSRRAAQIWLKLTALLGFAGTAFHAYGVSRNMGGWRNWSQNLLNGPPLPAPPSFTGLALAGLAALSLMALEDD